jgi:hypothetical protein
MENLFKGLKFVLCPGSLPAKEYQPIYEEVYSCWRQVWQETYTELNLNKALYSDAFTRQDLIGAVFKNDHCLGMCFFRWCDARQPDFSVDSYFSNWTPEHLNVLRSRGDEIIVSSYFTIHPLARRGNLGFSMKDLLVAISIETFMNSQAHAMAGNLRVDKKVNEVCKKWGGYLIESDVPAGNGMTGDLMGFFKDVIQSRPPMELDGQLRELWKNRLEIPRLVPMEEFHRTKIKKVA